jgi:aromatic ring-opening dioxygenase catalytic subunit (LigB family)
MDATRNKSIIMKTFELTDEQFNKILEINKEGGDPVMYLSGGTPMGRSLREKINDYWKELGNEMGFDWTTIKPISNRKFQAKTA